MHRVSPVSFKSGTVVFHASLFLCLFFVVVGIEYGNWNGPPSCPNLPFGAFADALQWAIMIIADLENWASAWVRVCVCARVRVNMCACVRVMHVCPVRVGCVIV
jgi:hypothetical protein